MVHSVVPELTIDILIRVLWSEDRLLRLAYDGVVMFSR